MAKAPNRHRAEVLLPGSGGRTIRFTVDAMERLESIYPEDWMQAVIDGLNKGKPSVIIACIENTIVGDPIEDVRFWADKPGLMDEVIIAIKDAMSLTFSGKTQAELAEEQAKKKRAEQTAALKAMGMETEQIERLLSLSESGLLDTAQGFAPAMSETSAE